MNSSASDRLLVAVANGLIPATVLPRARDILDRTGRPMRLALLGLPSAGKSAVLNLLSGEEVIADGVSLPGLLVQFGDTPEMSLTFADKPKKTIEGRDLKQAMSFSPDSVVLELPLQPLKLVNPLEIAADPTLAGLQQAVTLAEQQADLFVWCSETFSALEQAFWRDVPSSVKDRALLLVTKTDQLGDAHTVETIIGRISDIAGDEFVGVLSLSASLAQTAIQSGGTIDRDLFQRSGAPALISEIRMQIDAIRTDDEDTAKLILNQYATAAAVKKETLPTPAAVPSPLVLQNPVEPEAQPKLPPVQANEIKAPSPPQTQPKKVEKQAAVSPLLGLRAAHPEAAVIPTPSVSPTTTPRTPTPFSAQLAKVKQVSGGDAPPKAAKPPTDEELESALLASVANAKPNAKAERAIAPALDAKERPLVDRAITALLDGATGIEQGLPANGKVQSKQIVSQSAEIIDLVSKTLVGCEGPATRTLVRDVSEIQDLMLLMQLEQGTTPAYDAISLLIQLKRDLETARQLGKQAA